MASYGLVSAFADRLDPKLRACVERNMEGGFNEKPMTKELALALCRRLEADGAL